MATAEETLARQKDRLAYLKKNRPNDPEVKQLQAKIAAYKPTPKSETPSTGGGVTATADTPTNTTSGQTVQPPANNPPVVTTPPVVNQPPSLIQDVPIPTTGLSPEDVAALEKVKALIGMGEQFGRNIGNEFYSEGSLGRLEETLSPEELLAQEQIKNFAATAGVQSQDVKNLIAQQQGILTNAQQLSDVELEAIGVSRAALQGLNAPEMEALRSAARANIQGAVQAEARQLAKTQARGQVFGSAATAQRRLLGQGAVRETRNLERDLLIKNIDVKQAAQNQFNSLISQTEANRAGRTSAASGQLSGTLLTDEANRTTAQTNANKTYGDMATTLADKLRQLKEFNLNQGAAEKAGQIGSVFGGIGAVSSEAGLQAGQEFARKTAEEAAKRQDEIFKLIEKSLKSQNKTAGV